MYSFNSNPFPQLAHGNVFLPPSFFPHHSTLHEIFLKYPYDQIQEEPFSNGFFPVKTDSDPSPFVIDNIAAITDVLVPGSTTSAVGDQDHSHCDPNLGYTIADKKSRAKKDRHSMIFTAQGFRHRRVRLSIDIARKFFNLQDMLGFDKASQTLDWLFTNSETAIQELVEINNYKRLPYNSSSSTSECDELEILSKTEGARTELINKGSQKILNSKNKIRAFAVDPHIAKVAREKARTRARERTREKQWIRKLDEEFKKQIPHHNHSIMSSRENVFPALPVSGMSLVNEAPWKDIIVEAILTKKPLKSTPMYIYQQNMPVQEDLNSKVNYFPSITENLVRGSNADQTWQAIASNQNQE